MKINLPSLNSTGRNELVVLLLCLLIGFTLRYCTFDQKSLWLDEIYTYGEAKLGLKDQLKFYEEKPYYLHPPLFFILTHFLYPFTKPERDLRLLPLIFGTLSVPMIYFLSRLFSHRIALPCTLSLIFMAYHISLSQEGRSYSMLMFFGMVGLYFILKHLLTLKRRYLLPAALSFAILFHTSYSSIPFILFSQGLWFYQTGHSDRKHRFISFLIMNGLLLLMCLPWILFLASHYRGQPIMGHRLRPDLGSFWSIYYGILNDWSPHAPLMITSVILVILFPIFSKYHRNAILLLALLLIPIGGIYLYCELFNITHFITSRYFINFLPLFFITLYLSINAIEDRFERLRRVMRVRLLFVLLFIVSNLFILIPYYFSEKQDLRGLVTYLKSNIQDGDKILVGTDLYIPGMLHYFGIYPEGKLYLLPTRKISDKEFETQISLMLQGKIFTIYYSHSWTQYFNEGRRLWMVVNKTAAEKIKRDSSTANLDVKYIKTFDGSFLNFNRFPTDASMYLFLWDPSTPKEKGINLPFE